MSLAPALPLPRRRPWLGRLGGRLWAVVIALGGLVGGVVAAATGSPALATVVWSVCTVPVLVALLVEIVTGLMRGMVGLDLVAALSMAAGLAFGEPLAAIVVALMYSGGEFLEEFAEGRARHEMTALLGRVPRTAMRLLDGRLEEVPIETLVPGDTLLVRSGETLPVDGTVAGEGTAVIDESALTGEALPMRRGAGEAVMSGSSNVGDAFHLRVERPSADSTYARIVQLVRAAEESKAPAQRAADRLAVWFLLLTLLLAGIGWWVSGDHIRALAVLVVATPCPLILALPVAVISGMSHAARHGILVKNGGGLEALSQARTVILDKTGTLTRGLARLEMIRPVADVSEDRLLSLAASLDQASHHVVAEALVNAARERELPLLPPTAVSEEHGTGLSGRVDGHDVVVGGIGFVRGRSAGMPENPREGIPPGSAIVAVAIDGAFAGIMALRDTLRPEAQDVLAGLRRAGISRIVMASGDRQEVVDAVAREVHLDAAVGDLRPDEKLELVRREAAAAPTMMVGDGINDAPALATATIGVAMGARGAAASSETAGVVILVDALDRLLVAVEIAARTRRIATESVVGGLVLSLVGMVFAALGFLPPVAGALTQEAIDVAVILNALRALR
jgi:heavy metal translocating P-type ATPase